MSGGLCTLRDRADRGETLADELIIDIHCHMGTYYNFWVRDGGPEGMLRAMDRAGVRIACPSHHWALGADIEAGNDAVADAQERWPHRFIGVMLLNGNYPHEMPGEIRRMAARGVKHVKIHSVHGVAYDAPAYDAAFEWAEAQGAMVVAHTWGGKDLEQLAARARKHPRAKCIAVHAGCANVERYIGLARELDNLWLEFTYSAAPYGGVERLVEGAGAHKVVYGSDMPFFSMYGSLGRVLWARLSDEAKRRVLGLNAREILGL